MSMFYGRVFVVAGTAQLSIRGGTGTAVAVARH